MSQKLISQDPQTMRAVRELSDQLNCDLDGETLKILVELCETGVDPTALAKVVLALKKEKSKAMKKEVVSRDM